MIKHYLYYVSKGSEYQVMLIDTCIHSIIRQLLMTENATPHPKLEAKHSTKNTQYHVGLLNSSNTL